VLSAALLRRVRWQQRSAKQAAVRPPAEVCRQDGGSGGGGVVLQE